jgi:CheY-like chemotaxis protein
MAILVAHEGHQVLRAHDADAAMELLTEDKATRPDVMLVDLQMPGVSGGQLAERIRALGLPKPLLLAMSATAVQRRKLPVFDGFLQKPLAIDDLRKALKPKTSNSRKRSLRTTRSAPPADVVLDFAVIRKLLAMMPVGALHETVAACLADSRDSIETIRKSLGNDARVRHYAHRIKGAAAMIGANHLAKLAGGLEAGGDKGAATLHVLDDLVNACNELERMLFAGKFNNTQGPHDNHSHPSDS